MLFDSNGHVLVPTDESAEKYVERRKGKVLRMVEKDHSEQQHRTLFDYLNWLWKWGFIYEYPDPDTFRDQVSLDMGHVKYGRIYVGVKYLEELLEEAKTDGGWIEKIEAASWSFRKCDHEKFNALCKRINDWGWELTGVDIDTFLKNKDKYLAHY